MQCTLSVTGTFSDIKAAISVLENLQGVSIAASAREAPTLPNAYAKSGKLVSLNQRQFGEFYQGIDPRYQKGVKLFAKSGRVACEDLERIGITSPGHFKSRTSVRAKTVLNRTERLQFATYSSTSKNGVKSWFLEVPPETLKAMQSYFAANPKA